MFYLGIDLGSSSVKVALVDSNTGSSLAVVQEPSEEMSISAIRPGWAEQDPELWWTHVCTAIKRVITENNISENSIHGIGIAYQMHGLVLVDNSGNPLRDAIIWCDSRAVAIGDNAYRAIGEDVCDTKLLNSPANFTASKLKWVQENEPDVYERMDKFMLPGDYIAFKFTNSINTTVSGLSEGILWDFKEDSISKDVVAYYQFSKENFPNLVQTFSKQGILSKKGASESGLIEGTPILYRAGDQPNNALALNVFNPGEVAATGGTSGVVYAITDSLSAKETSRVNNFAHVNYEKGGVQRIGKLLCINGAGIQYRWLLNNLDVGSYQEMNELADKVKVGSDGLVIIPFGNGAERMLNNRDTGTRVLNLNLNIHTKAHMCRAALEGIAFSFVYGIEIMKADGMQPSVIRAGNDNLFRSSLFSNTIATLIGQEIEIYDTTGAVGAARACAITEKGYDEFSTFMKNDFILSYNPLKDIKAYQKAYQNWKKELELIIN
ncbi:xylulokinase [Croceitalea marina]|uniref:Xylulokinase n=1 Tax=Croceitalea marina TaxID=1775166 RepID=A0ABW5N124_9FLAO